MCNLSVSLCDCVCVLRFDRSTTQLEPVNRPPTPPVTSLLETFLSLSLPLSVTLPHLSIVYEAHEPHTAAVPGPASCDRD